MENQSPSPKPNNLEHLEKTTDDSAPDLPLRKSSKNSWRILKKKTTDDSAPDLPKALGNMLDAWGCGPSQLSQQSPEDAIDLEIRKLRARIKKAFLNFKNQTWGAWVLLFSKQDLALSLKNQKKGPGGVSISAFDKLKIFLQAFESIDSNTRKAISKINSESRNLDNKAILNVKKISSLELRKSITKKVFFIKPFDNEAFLFCKIEKAGEEMLRAGKGYVHKTKWKLVEACFYWLFFNKRDPLGKSVPLKNLSFIKMVEGVNNWLSPKSADSTRPDILITWNDSYPKEIKTYEARLGWNLFLDEKIIIKFKIPKNKGSKSQKLVRFKLNEDLISDGVIKERLKELTAKLKERVT